VCRAASDNSEKKRFDHVTSTILDPWGGGPKQKKNLDSISAYTQLVNREEIHLRFCFISPPRDPSPFCVRGPR
jgi:hypothetical protein